MGNKDKTGNERQQRRRQREKEWLKEHGFKSWEALHTSLMKAETRLTKRAPDYCFYCDEKKPPAKQSICQDCVNIITRNSG